VVVADNEIIAEETVDFMVAEAAKRNHKSTPCIVVGDLGDPNAIQRKNGFYNAVNKRPDLFNAVIEVPSKWDANTTLSNFEAAMQSHPEIDFVFTSTDFLYPQLRSVLEPLGKWVPGGDPDHVILGGLDGDILACRLMREGIVDATGVQDLFFESDAVMDELLAAIAANEKQPKKWIHDKGFALTQENIGESADRMWGCTLLE
jgi:inositol transport system substrate-binding protein